MSAIIISVIIILDSSIDIAAILSFSGQEVKFVKVYRSHVIYYSGHMNEYGTFISGMWSFYDTDHGEGTFSIWRQPV